MGRAYAPEGGDMAGRLGGAQERTAWLYSLGFIVLALLSCFLVLAATGEKHGLGT
jgi:hypothetical protein